MIVPILYLLLALGVAFLIVKIIDWRIGYSRFLNRTLRTPVGAALIVHNDRILLRFLPAGPFKEFWFLPSAYVHRKAGDRTTQDTAIRKALDINEDLEITEKKKLTRRGHKLSKLDTISYALQLGLVPTVIDVYELTISNLSVIPEDERTRWCSQETIRDFQGPLHPLVPEIIKLYFGIKPGISTEQVEEQVEEQSKRVFKDDPLRKTETKPADELAEQQVIDQTRGVVQ